MLEQDFGAIDWIAPISPDDIPGPPIDLSPSCHVGPTLAALGDPTAITAMTVPPEYHFGIPPGDLLIAIITGGLALSLTIASSNKHQTKIKQRLCLSVLYLFGRKFLKMAPATHNVATNQINV